MHRRVHAVALIAPALLLLFFRLVPAADPFIRVPILHFYIVSFTSLSATVVSFLLIAALGSVARTRHFLAAVAFGVMGSLFSVHGLTTPGAIIAVSHPAVPAVSWSSLLTLFSGGIIFALAGMDRARGYSRGFMLRFIIGMAVAVMMFVSIVVIAPHVLGNIEDTLDPWHQRAMFLLSFLVWLFAAVQLYRTWQETGNRIDGTLAFVAGLLTEATISMHLFTLWNLSWWVYHFLLLGGFLVTAYTLFTEYEQAREFRLGRYFLAAAAILTVLLALVASYLFSEFAESLITLASNSVRAGNTGQLTDALVQARYTGLLIAAVTMGLLFTALWLVVRRADKIIVSRTRELAVAYSNLRQAEAMRDDLSHMIVHDLRTPLTAILTSLGLLERMPGGMQSDTQRRIIGRTTRAAERLDNMIDEILMVSKMEKGELRLQLEDVSLSQLLTQQLDPYFLQAAAEDKTLELECPSELNACIDPALTGRIVENLVSNAFKYTMRGGHIRILAAGQNGTLNISVRDDGEGVPDEFKEQIFGKFRQVPDDKGRPLRKGTGLGLAFCRLAIEAQGGKIWVQDAPGGGSDFKIVIPKNLVEKRRRTHERTFENIAA